jgi:hypothetical protein
LSLLSNGKVRHALKTAYRDGTTHVIFEPMDFIARLVALVPKPRLNLTRFHGVFALNIAYRARVTPAKRGEFDLTHVFGKSNCVVTERLDKGDGDAAIRGNESYRCAVCSS